MQHVQLALASRWKILDSNLRANLSRGSFEIVRLLDKNLNTILLADLENFLKKSKVLKTPEFEIGSAASDRMQRLYRHSSGLCSTVWE